MNHSNHIIDNIHIGDIFSLKLQIANEVDQIISLVSNPFKNTYQEQKKCIEILFEDNENVDIVYYCKLIYPYLNSNKSTLIHCNAGKSRSASCVIYYIMKKYNKKFMEAYDMVLIKRPKIYLNRGFYNQLKII